MDTVTSRELKNRTGEVLRRIRAGGRVVVTNRGRPVAVLSPANEVGPEAEPARAFEEAWVEIEQTLAESKPEFSSWREALRRSRGRP